MASTLYNILFAVRDAIRGMSLTGIPKASVVVTKRPTNEPKDLPSEKYPCILVAPFGPETIDPAGGTNQRDDINYPVLVAILDNNQQAIAHGTAEDVGSNLDQILQWRETIRKGFHLSRLTGIDSVYQIQVQPQQIIDLGAWDSRRLTASALLLRVFSRETRG